MKPLQIYYMVLGGLFVFVVIYWVIYKFGPKFDLKVDRELAKQRSKDRLIKHQEFIVKHDKEFEILFSTFLTGALFFAGFVLYNIHSKLEAFSFSFIQIIGLVLALILGAGMSNDIKDNPKKSVLLFRGMCFLLAAYLLPCGIELSKTTHPHIFGTSVPRLYSLILAALTIGIGVKLVYAAIVKEHKYLTNK